MSEATAAYLLSDTMGSRCGGGSGASLMATRGSPLCQAVVVAAAVPAVPIVKPGELWFDTPKVLIDGGRYTIGWQRWLEKKGGPGYVTVRRSALGTFNIVDRYP